MNNEPVIGHARARAALAAAKTIDSRSEAVGLAISLGMSLSEVSQYLGVLDARQLASREARPQPPTKSWWFGWLSHT